MNTSIRLFTGLTALAVAVGVLPLHAQTWQTVDDFQAVAGLGAVGADMGTDDYGNIYSVGSGVTTPDGNGRVAVVQVSADQGLSWATLPEIAQPTWPWEHNRGFASDAAGRLYICGNGRFPDWPSGAGSPYVRESIDGGLTWVTTDALPDDHNCGYADVKVHPATGDVYTVGSSATLGTVFRKRAAGASQFSTVYSTGPAEIGSGWSIGFHPDGRVFVAGCIADTSRANHLTWIVLKSATGDLGSWATVDTFSSTEWTQSCAMTMNITPPNASGVTTIYVAGWADSSNTRKRQWVVRSSTDGGTTWAISDNFSYGGGTVDVGGMTRDAAGNLFVCGQAADKFGKLFWIVRKGAWTKTTVKGKPVTSFGWSTSDVFQLAPGKTAIGLGITADASRSVYVTGRAADAGGVDHAITRKLTP